MNDQSLASRVEAWIVDSLLQFEEFQSANGGKAEVYPGSTAPDGARLIAELVGNRHVYACVLFVSDQEIPLDGGESGWDSTYLVLVACRNLRPGQARFGMDDVIDGVVITDKGVNFFRDMLRAALHNKHPNQIAYVKDAGGATIGSFYSDATRLAGVRVAFEQKDAYILEATVIVREVPAAG